MKENLSIRTTINRTLASAGVIAYDQPDPSYVLGIDTSHWTGVVDWQKAKANGIKFAIIKFMDGKNKTRFAEENYKGVKDVGLLVGAYTWLYKATQVSPGGAAREYLAMLADHPCDIRPAVDYEWSPNGKIFNVDSSDLYGFVRPFAEGFGKRPMIYSARGYLDQYPIGAEYAGDPFWQARYASVPLPCAPWNLEWKFWQWTETGDGSKYGVPADGEKAVDLNYWRGTLEELNRWCGLAGTPTIPPAQPPTTEKPNVTISIKAPASVDVVVNREE